MSEFKQYTISKKAKLKEFMNVTDDTLTNLCIWAWVEVDLSVLKNFPNVTRLNLTGRFTGFENITLLQNLDTLELELEAFDCADLPKLMTPKLTFLSLHNMRKIDDLGFIEKAENLERLYLKNLPGVKAFPNFGKIYSLKVYELHKLATLESLKYSEIKYLDLKLCADKISATEAANTLMEIPKLEKVDFVFMDRNCRRATAMENRFIKCGKENLIAEEGMFAYDNWVKL